MHRGVRIGLTALAIAAAPAACAISGRSGLFNTTGDDVEALSEHKAAWTARHLQRRITRHQMLMLVREFEGNCISGDVNLTTVPMDRPLDDFLHPAPRPIDCIFISRSWPLLSLPRAYFWAVALQPISADELEVTAFRRQRETL